jgi:hypothetical protein
VGVAVAMAVLLFLHRADVYGTVATLRSHCE